MSLWQRALWLIISALSPLVSLRNVSLRNVSARHRYSGDSNPDTDTGGSVEAFSYFCCRLVVVAVLVLCSAEGAWYQRSEALPPELSELRYTPSPRGCSIRAVHRNAPLFQGRRKTNPVPLHVRTRDITAHARCVSCSLVVISCTPVVLH